MVPPLEQFDLKLQDVFIQRLELSRLLGENAAQPFGDIFAVLVSIYAGGFSSMKAKECEAQFNGLRTAALKVIDTLENLVKEDRDEKAKLN